jgi:hypothetical protein
MISGFGMHRVEYCRFSNVSVNIRVSFFRENFLCGVGSSDVGVRVRFVPAKSLLDDTEERNAIQYGADTEERNATQYGAVTEERNAIQYGALT